MTKDQTTADAIAGIVAALRGEIDAVAETELTASLASGWHSEFPAIDDENGVRLVGNRRTRIAANLGITPVVKVLIFGKGEEADVERARFATISNVGTAPLMAADRKRAAIHIYQTRGWTFENIGRALNVSKMTISRYLENCNTPLQTPRAEKRGRPKKPRKPREVAERQEKIVAFSDAGMPPDQVAIHTGVGRRMVDRVMEVEKARRQGPEPEIDPATLSKSAQEKLAAAIRAHKKKLDQEFNFKVTEGIRKWVDEVTLPAHAKELQDAQDLLRSRRYGVMPRKIFTLIRSCLHTDSRKSVSDKRLNEAFHEFSSRERLLLSEEDAPTITMTFPRTWAEGQEWKRKVKEQRKAKRSRAGMTGEVAR